MQHHSSVQVIVKHKQPHSQKIYVNDENMCNKKETFYINQILLNTVK